MARQREPFPSNSYCSETFTIHGLWPEYSSGGWPQFCPEHSHSPYPDHSAAQQCLWPSLIGKSESFWQHEWSKHGTCAEPLLGNRSSFVATVLDLHERYNLDMALGEAGIEPSASLIYEPADLEDAVRAAYDATPRVSCVGETLVELWMCLDLDLKPIDCPKAVQPGPRCHSRIRLPPGTAIVPSCQRFSPPWGQPDRDSSGQDTPSWGVGLSILAALTLTYAIIYTIRALLAKRELQTEARLLDALSGAGWDTRPAASSAAAAGYEPSDP